MGEGWFYKIKLADAKELGDLMDEAAYKAFTAEQDKH
jgi:glycine cleavage system H lipoate-binding protein